MGTMMDRFSLPYAVTILEPEERIREMLRFAASEECPGMWDQDWIWGAEVDTVVFTFSDPDAAFAFKMRWV